MDGHKKEWCNSRPCPKLESSSQTTVDKDTIALWKMHCHSKTTQKKNTGQNPTQNPPYSRTECDTFANWNHCFTSRHIVNPSQKGRCGMSTIPLITTVLIIIILVLTLGAHAQRGRRLSVKSHLTSGASVRPENSATYSTGNEGQKICGDFSETTSLQRYTASCVVGYCSDIPRTFSTAEPSKGPKKAKNRLNSPWNTTRCTVASCFLFSLRLLPKSSVYFPLT